MSMMHDFLDVFYGDRSATNFGAQLFHLIAKADPDNMSRIEAGFPRQVALYRWWMATPNPPTPEEIKVKAREIDERAIAEGAAQ